MDDGSKSVEESISILKKMNEQGVETVIASSHFYADQEVLERFLKRRERAFGLLQTAMEESGIKTPNVLLGAEVWYFDGISHSSSLRPLCTEGTDVLLLEMPFSEWTERMLDEIVSLREESGFTILLAHVERYLKWQKRGTLEWLLQHEILMQTNAEAFLERKTARKIMKMLERRQVHLIGSDCHNLTSRPPNYGEAIQKIRKTLGDQTLDYLAQMERLLYQGLEGVY